MAIPTAIELLKFLGFKHDPEHEFIPGILSLSYWIREFGTREKKASWTFQYDQDKGKVYFIPTPENVRLPIGEALNVDEAVKVAQEFLEPWLYDLEFHMKMDGEIQRLREERRKTKRPSTS